MERRFYAKNISNGQNDYSQESKRNYRAPPPTIHRQMNAVRYVLEFDANIWEMYWLAWVFLRYIHEWHGKRTAKSMWNGPPLSSVRKKVNKWIAIIFYETCVPCIVYYVWHVVLTKQERATNFQRNRRMEKLTTIVYNAIPCIQQCVVLSLFVVRYERCRAIYSSVHGVGHGDGAYIQFSIT